MFFVFFLFGQRFLDNPWVDSRQSSNAGVLWCRMCLLPFWRLASPGGGKGGMKFSLMGVNGEFLHFSAFWAISQQRVHGSIPNFICVGKMSVYTCPLSLWGPSAPGGRGGVKYSKNWGWSHSCIGQLPILFLSAMPNVVQYVGHRPAHILV